MNEGPLSLSPKLSLSGQDCVEPEAGAPARFEAYRRWLWQCSLFVIAVYEVLFGSPKFR